MMAHLKRHVVPRAASKAASALEFMPTAMFHPFVPFVIRASGSRFRLCR